MIEQTKIARLIPRIGGGLIDLLIVLIISSVILFFWGFFIGIKNTDLNLSAEEQAIMWKARGLLVGLVADLIYTVSMQLSSKRATLGQQAVGVCIVKVNYEKATFGDLLLRYFISIISSILLKIGFLIAVFTKDKRTLHDLIAGTMVVEAETTVEQTTYSYEQQTKPINGSAERKTNETQTKVTPDPNNKKTKTSIENDDGLWARALEEFESKFRIKGLYAKLYTQHDGNEQRIKSQYIKERFEQLKKEQKEIQAAEEAQAKEKIELLQKEQLEKKIKESALERAINGKINLVKTIRGIDCYAYEDGRVAIKVEEDRYRLYVDLETAKESIDYYKLGNKNYFDEEMRYLPNGFIGWITIDNEKKIISCPRCSQKTRVPSNKELEITCPSCKFQWREKT